MSKPKAQISFALELKSDEHFLSSEQIRDELKKVKSEIGNISGKLDALTASRQETKHEGKFLKLTNKTQLKQ